MALIAPPTRKGRLGKCEAKIPPMMQVKISLKTMMALLRPRASTCMVSSAMLEIHTLQLVWMKAMAMAMGRIVRNMAWGCSGMTKMINPKARIQENIAKEWVGDTF